MRSALTAKEANLLATLSEMDKEIFRIEDVKDALSKFSWSSNINGLLSRLTKKRWLARLKRGHYMIIPLKAGSEGIYSEDPLIVISRILEPAVISYWTGMNYHGFTEQIPGTVFVTTPVRKYRMEFKIFGVSYKLVCLKEEKIFGVQKVWIGSSAVNITDPERTIIDSLDHPEYCGGMIESIKAVTASWQTLDSGKVLGYLDRIGNSAASKRLGFILETSGIGDHGFLEELRERVRKGYSKLDPTGTSGGRFVRKWNIEVNVNENLLNNIWREEG